MLAKVFNSIGAILLPIMIAFLANNDMSYKFSFYVPIAAVTVLALVLILIARFPNHKKAESGENSNQSDEQNRFVSQPKFWVEGIALVVYGFTSLALIMIAPLWLPSLAQVALNMTETESVTIISYYSIGAFVRFYYQQWRLKRLVHDSNDCLLQSLQ